MKDKVMKTRKGSVTAAEAELVKRLREKMMKNFKKNEALIMAERKKRNEWIVQAWAQEMAAFAEGWIFWITNIRHEDCLQRDRRMLEMLPETGDWTLILLGEEPQSPVRFTDRAALLAAVDAVVHENRANLGKMREVLPTDGRPWLLFHHIDRPPMRHPAPSLTMSTPVDPGIASYPEYATDMLGCDDFSASEAAGLPEPGLQEGGLPEADDGLSGGERYAEFHANGFVSVADEPLSTFGLDVDTASYATLRRYLVDEKRLPPKDAVRLEEYVNAFSYAYPEPTGDVPLAVACELAACPWAPSHRLLRVGVQARRVRTENLPPANLVLLIDVSGSMSFDFDLVKRAVRMLVDQLREEDHVSIVTYAGDAALHLASTRGSRRQEIRAAVDALSCGGWTHGGAGIRLAYDEAWKHFSPQANNRVILISDGDFNVGPQGPAETERLIRRERGNGIFLTVLGVGGRGNYQDATMKRLSTAGKGNYAYLDGPLEAKKVLVKEFGSTMLTVAKDVKLQLEFNPEQVASYRLLGYECRRLAARDFADDRKDGGETGSGHSMTAFYELVPPGAAVAPAAVKLRYQRRVPVASADLFTVKLRYKTPQGRRSRLVETPVTRAEAERAEGPSEDFRFASAVAELALLLRDDDRGVASYAALLARARGAKGADPDGARAEFIRLAETAELLGRETREPKVDGGRRV